MEVREQGWMAMGTDPSGAVYGLWQPTGHRGFELVGEHGVPAWHQLTTRNFRGAPEFYREVWAGAPKPCPIPTHSVTRTPFSTVNRCSG